MYQEWFKEYEQLKKEKETMNEEEAIKILIELSTYDYVKLENGDVAIETLLNLLEKKDKMIDLMARAIDNYDSQLVINTFKDKEHVKQFFKEKVENGTSI